jgi:glycosyltransferase involved in cell wall biosynthesis
MDQVIHVIEPTLEDETGHCYSFVASLCATAQGHPLRLWIGKNAHVGFARTGVLVENHFFRTIRRLQAFFLYRRLLREEGRIFVATAGRTDLLLLDWAAGGHIPPRKVYLFFHWFRDSVGKRNYLARIARRQPSLVILGSTQSVVDIFRTCGFENTMVVPYPITPLAGAEFAPAVSFGHLLFAGAARTDKGFGKVVDLVELLARRGESIPIKIQSSAKHYGKYEPRIREDLLRLASAKYPHLEMLSGTLTESAYHALFFRGICIQPYDVQEFADRVSGVTLDALSAGCPVVTVRGTWMARVVENSAAGVVIDEVRPEALLAAVETVISDYPRYGRNAYEAGKVLQAENSADHLFRVLISS